MTATQPQLPFPREAVRKTHPRHAERLSDPEIAEIFLADIERTAAKSLCGALGAAGARAEGGRWPISASIGTARTAGG
jgi:hypothetical protein